MPASPFANLSEKALCLRHLRKAGFEWFMLFNDEAPKIQVELELKNAYLLNSYTLDIQAFDGQLSLNGYELTVVVPKDAKIVAIERYDDAVYVCVGQGNRIAQYELMAKSGESRASYTE